MTAVAEHTKIEGSAFRAWLYLVGLCIQRQARMRLMVLIALGLLALSSVFVLLNQLNNRWGMWHFRWSPQTSMESKPGASMPGGPTLPLHKYPPPKWVPYDARVSYDQTMLVLRFRAALPGPIGTQSVETAVTSAWDQTLAQAGLYVFSNWVVFSVFVGFLLPIWSLCFATSALGGERESNSLVWLLTRPLSRPAIYLAQFVALLPWSLVLNLGGFGLLCLLAGETGRLAFRLYWPAVLGATLAFGALFHLMAACFRRAAVVGLVYAFFLETILGGMPGYMKRISVSFYTRCLMFDAANEFSVQAEKPSIYLPVDGATAWGVLLSLTAVFLVLGTVVFARAEYQDLA